MESLDGQDVNPLVLDLRATIEDQAQYINALKAKIQENKEIQRPEHQLRIRVSLSQLYILRCEIVVVQLMSIS
jgi:hypothetical protein